VSAELGKMRMRTMAAAERSETIAWCCERNMYIFMWESKKKEIKYKYKMKMEEGGGDGFWKMDAREELERWCVALRRAHLQRVSSIIDSFSTQIRSPSDPSSSSMSSKSN